MFIMKERPLKYFLILNIYENGSLTVSFICWVIVIPLNVMIIFAIKLIKERTSLGMHNWNFMDERINCLSMIWGEGVWSYRWDMIGFNLMQIEDNLTSSLCVEIII